MRYSVQVFHLCCEQRFQKHVICKLAVRSITFLYSIFLHFFKQTQILASSMIQFPVDPCLQTFHSTGSVPFFFFFFFFFLNFFFFIDNIYITLTIRTNNTYNTLGYNERKKKIQLHSLLWLAYFRYILQSTKKSNIQL